MNLIRRSQTGDERAFAELFDQYKNLVYKTAYLMLGDSEEAEDALQEVFLRVHKSLASYRPSKGAFTTWLHRITVNQCINHRRKQRFSVLSLARVPDHRMPRHPSPEERLSKDDVVIRAIRRLSDKLRTVIVLRYYWDMAYAEIAETLDIPLGTVKSRLNMAMEILRKEIKAPTPKFLPCEEVVK